VSALEPRRDPDVLAEVTWVAMHGEVMLRRGGRLRADLDDARLGLLCDLVIDAAASSQTGRPRSGRRRAAARGPDDPTRGSERV
jgi:hypothetical protein